MCFLFCRLSCAFLLSMCVDLFHLLPLHCRLPIHCFYRKKKNRFSSVFLHLCDVLSSSAFCGLQGGMSTKFISFPWFFSRYYIPSLNSDDSSTKSRSRKSFPNKLWFHSTRPSASSHYRKRDFFALSTFYINIHLDETFLSPLLFSSLFLLSFRWCLANISVYILTQLHNMLSKKPTVVVREEEERRKRCKIELNFQVDWNVIPKRGEYWWEFIFQGFFASSSNVGTSWLTFFIASQAVCSVDGRYIIHDDIDVSVESFSSFLDTNWRINWTFSLSFNRVEHRQSLVGAEKQTQANL